MFYHLNLSFGLITLENFNTVVKIITNFLFIFNKGYLFNTYKLLYFGKLIYFNLKLFNFNLKYKI
jgi:hypothetical protein